MNEPGDGDGSDTNERLSSWKLPRSNSGAVIDADSLVIEDPPSLSTDPGPSNPGDLANIREDDLLPSLLWISLASI